MHIRYHLLGLSLLLSLLATGCGDKELEAKSREQQARIAELQIEVDLLTERLGPEDEGNPAQDLEQVQAELGEAQQRVAALKAELAQVATELEEAEKEFTVYQRNYPIPD